MILEELREAVALELAYLQKTADDAAGLLALTQAREVTVYDRAAAAMLLAQFYNGIENVLKRISTYHEIPLPEGESSHAELFRQFCDPPRVPLPRLFPRAVEERFVILRRFRHFVHHSYAYQFDWERLRAGMATLRPGLDAFEAELAAYLARLGAQAS